MYISLTPELEDRVKSKVEKGLYNNASEVIHVLHRRQDLQRHVYVDIESG
jgi:antitoxin ParD1/3/4